jgi:Xaa-Pro aminopeptidase
MDYEGRRQRLVRQLADEGLDACVISHPVNVSYLTGFSGEASYLVLTRSKTLLVSDGRFTEQIAQECPGLEAVIRPPSQTIQHATAEVVAKLPAHSVGCESGHLTVADFDTLREATPAVSWKGAKDRVEKLRMIKDEEEVGQIRQAIRIAERAFAMFRAMLQPADQEKDLSDALESYVRRAGGKCTSFPSIVAVGERAALPHAPPTSRAVGTASLVLVDWGASGSFYKSDLTRVLLPRNNSAFQRPSNEDVDAKIRDVYGVVLRAQERALQTIRPGVQAKQVDAAARTVIADAGYGDAFTHSVGHGLGMQVHEGPMLRSNTETPLEPGMVVTIEPGIYLPGWGGIRIEDDILVTPDGCEVLSHLPRDLEANMVDF